MTEQLLELPINTILIGDVLERLRQLPDNSVDLIITSPPYWQLRVYLKKKDPNKKFEIGNEATPKEYIDKLMLVMRECWRVLKKTGCLVVNIGDTYLGSKSGNTNGQNKTGSVQQKEGVNDMAVNKKPVPGLRNQSLAAIPARFQAAMIDDGWICRNEWPWWKRNAMPGSGNNKLTVDFEPIFFFVKEAEPMFWINEVTAELVHKAPLGIRGKEGYDWHWVPLDDEVIKNLKASAEKSKRVLEEFAKRVTKGEVDEDEQAPKEVVFPPKYWFAGKDIGKPEAQFWFKETYWQPQSYYFERQYRPYSEATLKELEKAYTGQGLKDYEANDVQNPSDVKRNIVKKHNTGIAFGGAKAEGYGRPVYSGKGWSPNMPDSYIEFRRATRPGENTGTGKSGTVDDPNAGLHNSTLSTKREEIIRVIGGKPFGSVKRTMMIDSEWLLVELEPVISELGYTGCVQDVTTKGFKGAHFATFPEDLIEMPIRACCPEWVCKKCGLPRFPILQPSEEYKKLLGKSWHTHSDDEEQGQLQEKDLPTAVADYRRVGLSDCGCNAGFESGGVVVDPFFGAGTVGVVALKNGRRFIGIELNKKYAEIAQKRIDRILNHTINQWFQVDAVD